jgi:hypothetical protein
LWQTLRLRPLSKAVPAPEAQGTLNEVTDLFFLINCTHLLAFTLVNIVITGASTDRHVNAAGTLVQQTFHG